MKERLKRLIHGFVHNANGEVVPPSSIDEKTSGGGAENDGRRMTRSQKATSLLSPSHKMVEKVKMPRVLPVRRSPAMLWALEYEFCELQTPLCS